MRHLPSIFLEYINFHLIYLLPNSSHLQSLIFVNMPGKFMPKALLLALASSVAAQQVYISADGPTPRSYCASCNVTATPTYSFTQFSFTQTETYRTATSRPSPTTTVTYALPYESLSSLVPGLATTTVCILLPQFFYFFASPV